MNLLRRFLVRRRPRLRPADPEHLQRIYRETHRDIEELRRAA
jgi:hypothetical protein